MKRLIFWLVISVFYYTAGAQNSVPSPNWQLKTNDTQMTISIQNNRLIIYEIKNPLQGWNWTLSPTSLPLLDSVKVGLNTYCPDWIFQEATVSEANGYTVTFRFTSTSPKLELKSNWRTQPGPGPVENWVTIENKSGGNITYGTWTAATNIRIKSNSTALLHYIDKTNVGIGKVYHDNIRNNVNITTNTTMIPFIMLDVDSNHGLYMGFEWELGGFNVQSGSDPSNITVAAYPITGNVTQGDNQIFTIPNVYYGTYQGDIDDGSNKFKKWFWNYKIPRSMYNNTGEPWIEACLNAVGDTPQSTYDEYAANGVECLKLDYWEGGSSNCWYTGRDWMYHPAVWPNGFDFAIKSHISGLKASLYMGGTYNDCNLSTIAGRDAELSAVMERYDKGWFDMWRTDYYTAPYEPIPKTYEGVTNFLFIQDSLINSRPGYRYENCCNGGTYKGFAICRRMTYCTMNDIDRVANTTRTTFYSNSYAINQVQLKSDLGPDNTAFDLRTDMLGAILTWSGNNEIYRKHIALYKAKQRPILRGADVYHILPMPDGINWDGLQFYNTSINKGSVFLFKPSVNAVDGDSKVIKLKGLDRDNKYELTFQDRTELNCTMTGAQLMDSGINVTNMAGDNASEIIWLDGNPDGGTGYNPVSKPSLGLSVYPNPSNKKVSVDFYLPRQRDARITIYNNTGNPVEEVTQPGAVGYNHAAFDVSGWAAGVYLIRVVSGSESDVARLNVLK